MAFWWLGRRSQGTGLEVISIAIFKAISGAIYKAISVIGCEWWAAQLASMSKKISGRF